MDNWNEKVYPNVVKLCKIDERYNHYLHNLTELEEKYLDIMESLPQEEREAVEKYILYCEECGYRFAQLTYLYASCFEEK